MKRIISAIIFSLIVFAAAFTPASAQGARLLDGAGLLDEYSAEAVTEALDRMSEQLKMELVIVTTDSTDGREPRDYAADIYDYGDYGYNTTNDGIVLLIVMDDRYVGMTSTGKGRSVYTASVQNDMRDVITPYLSDGDYERAFLLFCELCSDAKDAYDRGESYDVSNYDYSEKMPLSVLIIASMIIGLIVALIAVLVMRSKMKSVRSRNEASDYVRPESFNSAGNEIFLYRTVDRREKPQDNGGSSGGSHTGSSGVGHTSTGGHF